MPVQVYKGKWGSSQGISSVYKGGSGWPSRKMLLQKTGLATQIPFFWGMSWSLLNEGVVSRRACAAEGGRNVAFGLSFVFGAIFMLFKMALCRLSFFVPQMFWDTLSERFFKNCYYDYFSCLNLMYSRVLHKPWNILTYWCM